MLFNRNSTFAIQQSLLLLRALCAVFRPTLLASLHANGVEPAADDVIADAGKMRHTAVADQYQRELLEVVTVAGDVGRDREPVGEPDARDLAKRGIRLLRRLREHADTHAALLRADL